MSQPPPQTTDAPAGRPVAVETLLAATMLLIGLGATVAGAVWTIRDTSTEVRKGPAAPAGAPGPKR